MSEQKKDSDQIKEERKQEQLSKQTMTAEESTITFNTNRET